MPRFLAVSSVVLCQVVGKCRKCIQGSVMSEWRFHIVFYACLGESRNSTWCQWVSGKSFVESLNALWLKSGKWIVESLNVLWS